MRNLIKYIKTIEKKDYKFFAIVAVVIVAVFGLAIKDTIDIAKTITKETEEFVSSDKGVDIVRKSVKRTKEYTGFEGFSESMAEKLADVDGSAEYEETVSSDTFVFSIDGESQCVKLIGVDVPEDVVLDDEKSITHTLVDKMSDTLMYYELDDVEAEDDCLMVYLYFSDGTMVQEWLLEQGYARAVDDIAEIKYKDLFEEAEETAMENKAGLWAGYFK